MRYVELRFVPLLLASCAPLSATSTTAAVPAVPDASDANAAVPDAAVDAGVAAADTDVQRTAIPAPRPVLLVHGVSGNSSNFAIARARLVDDGWPDVWVRAIDFPDPTWGCNVDNAETVRAAIEQLRTESGQPVIDIVAHSMGSLSTRYFLKVLNGSAAVGTYVTLGGPHHGITTPCLSPIKPCVWDELCESGEFIAILEQEPITPGPARWVSIASTADAVVPFESSELDGAENIAFDYLSHADLLTDATVYAEVRRVLSYDALPR